MNKIKANLAYLLNLINVDVMMGIDKDLEIEIDKKLLNSITTLSSPDGLEDNKSIAEMVLNVIKLNKVLAKYDLTIIVKFISDIPLDAEYNKPTYLLTNGVVNLESYIMVEDIAARKEKYYYFISGELLLDMLKRRGCKQLLR